MTIWEMMSIAAVSNNVCKQGLVSSDLDSKVNMTKLKISQITEEKLKIENHVIIKLEFHHYVMSLE